MNERQGTLLEAYRDGELSGLARWRVRRWLRRDPAAQRHLEGLQVLGELLREVDADGPAPDLWPAIRVRLAAVDEAPARGWRRGLGYLAAGAVAASAAAFALMLAGEEPRPVAGSPGAVRWIDPRGHPMLVLRDDSAATIIWVTEQAS